MKREKKHTNIKNTPKIRQLGSHPKNSLCGGSFLKKKEKRPPPPPNKELGLSNLYAGDPFNSLCGFALCAFFDPYEKPRGFKMAWATTHPTITKALLQPSRIIDLLVGLFRGAVFHHGRDARKQPIEQPAEMPTSTMALMGPFPLVNGPFSDLNGAFHRFRPKGPFYLLKIHWKKAH